MPMRPKPTRRVGRRRHSDFRGRRGFRTLGAPRHGPDRCARLPPAGPARPRGRSRPGARETARALAAQMRWAGGSVGRARRRPRLGPHDLLAARGHAADARLGAEALHLGRRAAPARPRRAARHERAGRRRRPTPPASSTATSTCAAAATRRSTRSTRGRLAQQVADAGHRRGHRPRARRRVGVRQPPRACRPPASASTSDVGPLSALTFNRGRTGRARRTGSARPARFAATAFSKQLRQLGVAVRRGARRRASRREAATLVTEWRSAPVADLLRLMNPPSDNFMAETLVKVLGARFGTSGSTDGGHARRARGARRARHRAAGDRRLGPLAQRPHVAARGRDACSRRWTATPSFTGSLAVAGRTGTLQYRMRGTQRAGPLPRQDRHAARRLRAGRLLHDDRAAPTSRSRSS